MTTAIDAGAYYAAHQASEKEYVRVYAARAMATGESTTANAGGFLIETSVEAPGYELSAYQDFQNSAQDFLTAAEFKAKTLPASALPLAVAREDITAEEAKGMVAVAKGTKITIDVGLPIQTRAPHDGFTVDVGGSLPVFMSNYEVGAAFNYAGQKKSTQEELVVRLKDEAPLKGIVLTEDVTFDFKEGAFEAKAGSFLYPNKDDVDGFTVSRPGFAMLGLRENMSQQQLDAQARMATDAALSAPKTARFKKR
ncbi:MAG: hypothetical protein PSY14_16865 [bacterium]|nr:hypothetical protein [bacterium]